MKKKLSLLIISALAVFAVVVMMPSCEGPAGPPGADGVDGTDGTDGVDANSFCIDCHTMDNKNAIMEQYTMYASHGPNNGSINRGARVTCAKCHSTQGYLETILTGADTIATAIGTPLVFQCDMCHDFHGTLAEDEFPDYALRHNEPVSMMYNGHISTLDLEGSGNLCSYCHQPRPRDGFPLIVGSDDSVAVTSSHWGTHYGTASVILGGQEGFEIPGSMAYENSGHTNILGCSECHMMKNESRMDVGGHTFRMTANGESEDGYEHIATCTGCHSDATTFDYNGVQTEMEELIHHLDVLLMEHKLIDDTGHAIPYDDEDGIGRKWTTNEAGAVFNLLLMHYEGSHGIHNYKYSKALIVNTTEMVEAW